MNNLFCELLEVRASSNGSEAWEGLHRQENDAIMHNRIEFQRLRKPWYRQEAILVLLVVNGCEL